MSFYVINSEYDIDVAVRECMKLINLQNSNVKLAFNNMSMVNIFMSDLTKECEKNQVDPEEQKFHMDVLVTELLEDDGDLV